MKSRALLLHSLAMAELISIRVVVFFVAFFALRPLMFMLIPQPNRAHGLGLLGVSTLVAFLASAFVLDEPVGQSLVAWAVIYVIIAVLWFARWKGADNRERWQEERRAWDEARRQAREEEEG